MTTSNFQVTNLKCEYRRNPLGIDVSQPRLSWQLDAPQRGAAQWAFQVVASLDKESLFRGDSVLWDSGRIETDQSIHIPYAGPTLQSRQRIYWRVRIWDENNQPSAWSETAWFEMGFLDEVDWQGQWIGNPLVGGPRTPVPSPYFRKEFELSSEVQSARLYITSLGIYEANLNGQQVGTEVFTPGWTDYDQRVQYQVYDVAELLTPGSNTIGAVLGDGWYCGHVAWEGRQRYGDRPKLLAQLEITLTDGRIQAISTDETWETAVGPLLEADLVMGEAYDARIELENWSPAITYPHPTGMAIVAQNTTPIRAKEELIPIKDPSIVWSWPHHNWIFDFGQNLVGRVRLRVKGERGTTITLRFGEMLDENEKLYTINLRSARQIDYYTLKGDPEGEVWESKFTSHGFRYVEIEGITAEPGRDTLTAIVLHSDNPPALEFECSDPLLNQLQHNILWGWKGNSVEIPTDCPQRDERLGWTGDGQVFVKTATYLSDSASFFTKWIQDMADTQLDYGAIPAVAPATKTLKKSDGGAAWSDAFIIVPWTIWQQYGDTRVLETHYAAMCAYMDYLVENSPDLIRMLPDERELGQENADWQIGGYGDWLAQDGNTDIRGLTPKNLIGTAFLAYDANLMAQIATALGKHEDANKFSQLFRHTRQAFIDRFITRDGMLVGQTQTGYLLALYFDLVPEHLKEPLTAALLKDIEVTRKNHMSTGFVGTPYINQVLTDVGRVDLAYTLLLQKTFPSWLYSVIHGATTIWERWDGWTEENGFHDPGMNSFNHYAYGAVGTWMYENIAGIRTDPQTPGFKHIILAPTPGGELTHARGVYQSPYGEIKSGWHYDDQDLIWEVSIPPNTTGTVHIPASPNDKIFEGDSPITAATGVEFIQSTDQAQIYRVVSGSYRIKVVKVQD